MADTLTVGVDQPLLNLIAAVFRQPAETGVQFTDFHPHGLQTVAQRLQFAAEAGEGVLLFRPEGGGQLRPAPCLPPHPVARAVAGQNAAADAS